MIQSENCPYRGIRNACCKCPSYNADMDICCNITTAVVAGAAASIESSVSSASTYDDRLKDYQEQRERLLKLSKEQLVDLIIHEPTIY